MVVVEEEEVLVDEVLLALVAEKTMKTVAIWEAGEEVECNLVTLRPSIQSGILQTPLLLSHLPTPPPCSFLGFA